MMLEPIQIERSDGAAYIKYRPSSHPLHQLDIYRDEDGTVRSVSVSEDSPFTGVIVDIDQSYKIVGIEIAFLETQCIELAKEYAAQNNLIFPDNFDTNTNRVAPRAD